MSVILDVGVVAQVAQITLGTLFDAVFFELAHDLVEVRSGSRLRIVASAQHEYADAFFERAEGRGGLADLQLQDDVLQLLRQGTDADLIVGHDIRAEFGGDVFRVTAATVKMSISADGSVHKAVAYATSRPCGFVTFATTVNLSC